ncbi:hypothetical protein [Amycolatopsis sp. H20-H5]|uniref:hypothetical protein n=1 Tax=Amycolatopsis sp. H20-H5 TaxID=3046309 RepID=UPI002DBE4D76|nr:hypothetical protein [Amycolatopsis sp. H20-H5]MEC3974589.1 hypothetical protein [Amycolatopsis sp. H20-H5]
MKYSQFSEVLINAAAEKLNVRPVLAAAAVKAIASWHSEGKTTPEIAARVRAVLGRDNPAGKTAFVNFVICGL